MLTGKLLILLCLACMTISCREKKGDVSTNQPEDLQQVKKPGSTFHDTLFVQEASAVFFEPDAIQLRKIRAVTEPRIFEGMMHEYFYQMRNARFFLKQSWPGLKIIHAVHFRFLSFRGTDGTVKTIDLNKYDPCGMFVYHPEKLPARVEMMNVETEVTEYFTDHNNTLLLNKNHQFE